MIGKPNPDWTYGFTLSADWKGLDFSAFFQGSIGNDIYKLYRRSNVTFGNYDKSWLNRWHGEGTSNWVPRVIDGDNNNYQVSNFFVEDGSYMRLKVLQIGYSLPGQMLQRVVSRGCVSLCRARICLQSPIIAVMIRKWEHVMDLTGEHIRKHVLIPSVQT